MARHHLVVLAALVVACNGRVVDESPTDTSVPAAPATPPPVTGEPGTPTSVAPSVGVLDVASLDGEAISMTSDDATLFVGMQDGRILAVPKSGGAPTELAKKGMATYPEGIATDDTFVYVASLSQRNVARVPKSGGAFEVLADNQNRPYQLAIDATHIYWVDQGTDDPNGAGNDGRVLRMPKAGGAVEVLASAQQKPNALALDDTNVFFTNGEWGDVNGSIRRVAKKGGDVQVLARRLGQIDRIVVDRGNVWFVDWTLQTLFSVPMALGGGDATPTSSVGRLDTFGLAPSGGGFYATSFDRKAARGALLRLGGDGSEKATLAQYSYDRGTERTGSVATIIDASRAFWIDVEWSGGSGTHSTLRSAVVP